MDGAPAAARVLIHTHVPKCAGAAVNELIRQRYGRRCITNLHAERMVPFRQMTVAERDAAIDCIGGHFRFGLHRLFSRPVVYFSTVRDPVERMCSYFNYVHQRPEHGAHAVLKARLRSMNDLTEALVASDAAFRFVSNQASWFYTGQVPADDTYAGLEHGVRFRMRRREFVVGPLGQIVGFLREAGLLGADEDLPRVNESRGYRPLYEFEFARPSALSPRVRALMEEAARFDYRLLAAIDTVNRKMGNDPERFARVGPAAEGAAA